MHSHQISLFFVVVFVFSYVKGDSGINHFKYIVIAQYFNVMHAKKREILLLPQELFSLHFETGRGTFSQSCWRRLRLNHCRPDSDAAITLACTWARQDVRLFVLP